MTGGVARSGTSTEDVPLVTNLHQPEHEDTANTPDSNGKTTSFYKANSINIINWHKIKNMYQKLDSFPSDTTFIFLC